jgi:hypothetical protein
MLCWRVLVIAFVITSLRLVALIWIPWRIARCIRRIVVAASSSDSRESADEIARSEYLKGGSPDCQQEVME